MSDEKAGLSMSSFVNADDLAASSVLSSGFGFGGSWCVRRLSVNVVSGVKSSSSGLWETHHPRPIRSKIFFSGEICVDYLFAQWPSAGLNWLAGGDNAITDKVCPTMEATR
jgi:hypothetical protein